MTEAPTLHAYSVRFIDGEETVYVTNVAYAVEDGSLLLLKDRQHKVIFGAPLHGVLAFTRETSTAP